MRSLSMTLLHKMTHYDEIGAAARGTMRIIDEASGAYECLNLGTDEKADNGQNYAWFAGEAFWSSECRKIFLDPVPGIA